MVGDFNCHGQHDITTDVISLPARTKAGWRLISHISNLLDKATFSLSARYVSAFLKVKFVPIFEYDKVFDIYKKVYPAELQESLQITATLIERLSQRCRQEGIAFLVLLIPSEEQVRPALWQDYVRSRGGALSAVDYDLRNPQLKLIQALSSDKIPYIDLLPYYRAQRGVERFYYPRDRHFNVNGHRLAGSILSDQLGKILPR